MKKSAIILFAHGARDPQWAEPFRKMQERIGAQAPGVQVELAFLEGMAPSLEEAAGRVAAAGATRVSLIPLFMAQGGHLKQDLPRIIERLRQRHPELQLQVSPAIGEVDAILDAISRWAAEEHRQLVE